MSAPVYIAKTDFVGTLAIDFGGYTGFDELAAKFEVETLIELLGQELYTAFVAGLAASPVLAKWTDLKSGLASGYANGTVYYRMRGTTEMLKYLFYYHYRKFSNSTVTSVGEFQGKAANSEIVPESMEAKMQANQNTGIEIFNEVVDWINFQNSQNGSTYYKGFQTNQRWKEFWF
jgi:hypothetical protein